MKKIDDSDKMRIAKVMNPKKKRGALTSILAMDCEFVKSFGWELLAWATVVNYYGEVLIDTLVSHKDIITDCVTHITGITPELLEGAPAYQLVNSYIVDLLASAKCVVGHTLECDLKKLVADKATTVNYIDVSEFHLYLKPSGLKTKLKILSAKHLNAKI